MRHLMLISMVMTLGNAAEARAEDTGTPEVQRGSNGWDAGAIGGAVVCSGSLGFGIGAVIGTLANQHDYLPYGVVGAVGGAIAGIATGFALGEWARDGSLAAKIIVFAVDFLATAATATILGYAASLVRPINISFSFAYE
jgi:hypothetical protein